jgi:hypothetical protein
LNRLAFDLTLVFSTDFTYYYLQKDAMKDIALMIDNHHKITPFPNHSLVELFRQADWIDATQGLRSFGKNRKRIHTIRSHFGAEGFYWRLVEFTFERVQTDPFDPAPMFNKW